MPPSTKLLSDTQFWLLIGLFVAYLAVRYVVARRGLPPPRRRRRRRPDEEKP